MLGILNEKAIQTPVKKKKKKSLLLEKSLPFLMSGH